MTLLRLFLRPVECDDFERPLDVWSFRAQERLRVHEARTEAELASAAKPAQVVGVRYWLQRVA